jgi:histidinol-phosphate aminotransferase
MFDLKSVIRANILELKPYHCARDDYFEGILLDANENTHGNGLETAGLERYPDPYQSAVKSLFGNLKKIDSKSLFIGVGSDECIDIIMRIFCNPTVDKILITPPTYGMHWFISGMYSVSAQINNVGVVKVPLIVQDGSFQLNVPQVPL